MKLSVESNGSNDFTPIRFEGRAKIVQIDPGEVAHQSIGNHRRNTSQDEPINPFLPPTTDDVVTLINLYDKIRYILWRMLEVAVHWDNDLAARVVDSGCNAACLSKVGSKLNELQQGILNGERIRNLIRVVTTAVVDKNDLI